MLKGETGMCPRVFCERQPVVPYGESSTFGECQTKVYCPKCSRLYVPDYPRHQKIDGAHFGPSLAGHMVLIFPGIVFNSSDKEYRPKIFGFKVH